MDRVNNLGKFERVIMMEQVGLTSFCAGSTCGAVVLRFLGRCRRSGGAWRLVLWRPWRGNRTALHI